MCTIARVLIDTAEEGSVDVNNLGSMIVASVDSHTNKKYLTDLSSNTIHGRLPRSGTDLLPASGTSKANIGSE